MPGNFARSILVTIAVVLLSCCEHTPQRAGVIDTFITVCFEYMLTRSDDGSFIDSNIGGEPYIYVHGGGQLLPGLEAALTGMRVGERRSISLPVDNAYGPFNPNAFEEIPVELVPEQLRTVGAEFETSHFNRPARVHEVREKTIVLDFNHPLAGKDLTYSIRVISIE